MDGFFTRSEMLQVRAPKAVSPRCGACGLYKTCNSPKMPVDGRGRAGVLVIGEAPGREEDEQGRPFVGETGRLLRDTMEELGVDLRQDCWLYNSIICFPGDTRIKTPSPVEIGYRRQYHGDLVRIKTAGGRVLTGTPNHPVLTTDGWIPLGQLEKFDNLVCHASDTEEVFSYPDVKDRPPTFEELFRSLQVLGHSERVVGRGVDFHGDGEEGDVDVTVADSLLGHGAEAEITKDGYKLSFVPPDHRPGPFLRLRNAFHDPSHEFGGSLLAPNSIVGGGSESLPSLRSQIGVADSHGVRPLPERNAKPFEHQSKAVRGNAEGTRQRLESLPGFVTTDRVIHVERKGCDETFDGDDAAYGPCHVYNLQTQDGYYIANGIVVSNCRPPSNKIANHPLAVGHCSPNVERTIRELKPKVIILLGGTAVKSVIGRLWKGEDPGGVGRWVGWRIPAHAENSWVCPTYHPSFLLHMKEKKQQDSRKVHERLFRRHLKAALNKAGSRPWPDGSPDYLSRVETVMDPAEAARRLRCYTSGTIAFDYENDRLKPDHAEGRFVCASVCWNGTETIAFPWRGEVVGAMKELLANPDVGKIASNLKHEHRWTLARLGVRVRNWAWDTMLAAHAADSRGGISSIKFQAFVRLGQPDYAHHISEFLRPRDESKEGGNAPNQIHSVPMSSLLLYCGMDSLLEYEVAKLQMLELGVTT